MPFDCRATVAACYVFSFLTHPLFSCSPFSHTHSQSLLLAFAFCINICINFLIKQVLCSTAFLVRCVICRISSRENSSARYARQYSVSQENKKATETEREREKRRGRKRQDRQSHGGKVYLRACHRRFAR